VTATNNTISDDTEDPFENLNELAASVESHTDALTIIRKRSDGARANHENKVGIIQGFQQTSCFENGPERIDAFRKHGVRIMQITYNKRNALRDGCLEPANAGINQCRHCRSQEDHVGVRLIVEFAAKPNIAVLPGALTPTEGVTAWSGGATLLFGAAITDFVSTSFV
jgi:hypothetical protein